MSNTKDFVIENGVLTEYHGGDSTVVIPEGITAVGDKAFMNCESIVEVVIPEGVTSIGNHAFRECKNLTSVEMPASLTKIGQHAFYECENLKDVELPAGLKDLEFGAFRGCMSLARIVIPQTLLIIQGYVFERCSSLEEVVISGDTKAICECAFARCTKLKNLVIPAGVLGIDRYAFSGCSSMETVILPTSLKVMDSDAFHCCNRVVKLEIPASVLEAVDPTLFYVGKPRTVTVVGKAQDGDRLESFREYFPEETRLEWKSIVEQDSSDVAASTNAPDVNDSATERKEKETEKNTESIPGGSASGESASASITDGVFRKEKYHGKHETGESAEYVSPLGTWAIQVPEHCVYTMDPDCAAAAMWGQKHPFQFQAADDCNFEEKYDSSYSFVLYPNMGTIHANEIYSDLTADGVTAALLELASEWGAAAGHDFVKHTKDIAVLSSEITAKKNDYAVEFFIACGGYSCVSQGQVVLRGLPVKQARQEAKRLLETVINVRGAALDAKSRLFAFPTEYDLSFEEGRNIELGGSDVKIPVPDGYDVSQDNNAIGGGIKLFAIIPSDYSDFANAMDATIGMSGLQLPGMIAAFDAESSGDLVDQALQQGQLFGMFDTNLATRIVQMTDRGIIAYQIWDDENGMWQFMKVLIYVDREVYVLSAALNYPQKWAKQQDVRINAEFILSRWLSFVEMPGEKLYGLVTRQIGEKLDVKEGRKAEKGRELETWNDEYDRGEDEKKDDEECGNEEDDANLGEQQVSGCEISGGVLISYDGDDEQLSIPDGVTCIGDFAICALDSLTSVTIPSSVTSIGEYAFSECRSLTSIIIPSSVTHIGNCAFEDCASLARVIMPKGLTDIGEDAFHGCDDELEIIYV